MTNGNGSVETPDLGLACFLYSCGAELVSVDRSDPRQAIFSFEVTPDQKERIVEWQSGSAVGNLLGFWASYQRLKLELYNKARR